MFFKQFALAAAIALASGATYAGNVTVSAAASLTNAFKEITELYEARYPDAKVALNFGASGSLLQQIAKGAPVDVFASADQETMDRAQEQKLLKPSDRRDFVHNALVVIEPVNSKINLKELKDFDKPEVKRVTIGNPASVPVGRYTKQALETANLWEMMQGKMVGTQNVRQALDYVARGEVDAGFVYATDAAIMPEKVKVRFDVPTEKVISYPIAKLSTGDNGKEAERFISFVVSDEGMKVLQKYGFRKP